MEKRKRLNEKVWIMEVKLVAKDGQINWKAVRCSDGRVYFYDTEAEAMKMLETCYPRAGNSRGYGEIDSEDRRIREVNLDEVKNGS